MPWKGQVSRDAELAGHTRVVVMAMLQLCYTFTRVIISTRTCQSTDIPPPLLEQTVSTRILLSIALSHSSLYCPLAQEMTVSPSCLCSKAFYPFPENSSKPSK